MVHFYSHSWEVIIYELFLIWNLVNLKKNNKFMYLKTVLKDCKCIHCQEKLEQINRSRLYWDKLIVDKKSV